MKLHLLGCSHHSSPIEIRERIAFDRAQVPVALATLRDRFPETEAVLLSTCNRVELYFASEQDDKIPPRGDIERFLAEFHKLPDLGFAHHLNERTGSDAIRHLFEVAASLDSMVMGEAQILAQVKEAYQLATDYESAGPLTHGAFQAAIRVARRVSNETGIHQRRVSVPSVAVAEFAKQIFERLDDKFVLVIGAGEMGEETLRYLVEEGTRDIHVVNRHWERAEGLASQFGGAAHGWDELDRLLVQADLVISTTGAREPIVTWQRYQAIEHQRYQRTLIVLDLAVPRDFEPRIGDCLGVYLYSVDDLQAACEINQRRREKEWPKAQRIVQQELTKFVQDWNHRATAPTIRRLREQAERIKEAELERLKPRLGEVDPRVLEEIDHSFQRMVNKLLHPPLESLRDEAGQQNHQTLIDALRKLFQLGE
ncbi:MAG: glutamyl-tRNA reductase [Pirellulales bacterium]